MSTFLRRLGLLLGLLVLFSSGTAWGQTANSNSFTIPYNAGKTLIPLTGTVSGNNRDAEHYTLTTPFSTNGAAPGNIPGTLYNGMGTTLANAGDVLNASSTASPNTLNQLYFLPSSVGTFKFNFTFTELTTNGNGGSTTSNTAATITITVTAPVADVATTIAPTPSGPVNAGTALSFAVTFTNNGPNSAAGVSRTLALTPGLNDSGSNITISGAGGLIGTYNNTDGSVTFNQNPTTLATTENLNVTVSITAVPGNLTQVVATTNITTTTSEGASPTGPDSATSTVTITPIADVTTTLAGPASLLNNQAGSFTVTYTNNGPSTAPSVTRTVTLPTGATAISAPGGSVAGSTITYPTLINQPSGGTASFTFSYTTPASGTSITTTSNASVSGGANDPNLNNNTATVTTTLTASADVLATLTGPANAPAGSFAAYLITFTNTSTTTASTNVVPVVLLPNGSTEVSASNQGTFDSGTSKVTFPAIASLAANASLTYRVQLRVPASGTIKAVASNTSDTPDPVPNNNNGSATNAIVTTTITQSADISVTANGPAQAVPGAGLTYNILVTNYGPSTATGVTAKLVFSGTTPTTATVGGGGTFSGNTVTFTVPNSGTLAAGTSAAYTVRFTAPAAGASVTGTVSGTTTITDPAPTNNDGSTTDARVTTTVLRVLPSTQCVSFSTMDFTFNGGNSLNTYYRGTATAAAGQKNITIGAATPTNGDVLVTGDLVAIMQMQGADINPANDNTYGNGLVGDPGNGQLSTSLTAGQYEYGVVTSISGTTVTLQSNLINTYQDADYSGTTTPVTLRKRFQLIRIPRYRSVTLAVDVNNVPAWDGNTGGILVLDMAGQLDLAGHTINLKGKGFRGGAGVALSGTGAANGAGGDYVTASPNNISATAAVTGTNSSKGEGIVGTPRYVNNGGARQDNTIEGYPGGSFSRGAPGNAGGGGTDSDAKLNDENTGGGGGSNAGVGGTGGNGWNSNEPYGGNGGAAFLAASPSRLIMGGGGGAGTTNDGTGGNPTYGFASSGSAGGGLVLIRASTVSASAGTIDVSGADVTFTPANDGSGGAGAGGSVLLITNNSLSNVTILAKGGTGGTNTGGATITAPHGPGGGGSGGLAFTSSAIGSGSLFAAGNSGTTIGSITYGATPGTTSMPPARTDITAGETPLLQAAANCVADLGTTLTGPTQLAAGSNSGTYTATFTNTGPAAGDFASRTVTLPTNATLTAAQQAAIVAQEPTATFSTSTNANTNTVVTTISFGAVNGVTSGGTRTYTFSFTTPSTVGATGSVASTLTPATTTNEGSNTAPNSATINVTTGTNPVALDVTNVPLQNTTDLVVLNPNLRGNASTGRTIASYLIITLPASGQLYYNGTPLTTSNTGANSSTLPITDLSKLSFQPVAGFTGTSFTYQVKDNFSTPQTSNTATYTIPALVADVTVSLTGPATLNASQPSGIYTATFTNEGPSAAIAVTRTVTLPDGASLTASQRAAIVATYSAAASSTTTSGATVIDFGSVASLSAHGTSAVAFAFTAPTTLGGSTLSAGTSTTISQGTNLAPDQTQLLLNTVTTADVVAVISGTTSLAGGVNTATFSVSFSNNGPQTAAGVVRTVQLPMGLTDAGVTKTGDAAGATYNPATGLLTYLNNSTTSIAANISLTSTISYAIPAGSAQATATAVVSTTTYEGGLTANNTASTTLPSAFDLTTTLSGATTVVSGSPMTLFVTTTNNGPSAVPITFQTVTIPSTGDLTNKIYLTNGGTYSYNSSVGRVTFAIPANLPSGQAITNSISFNAPGINFTPSAQVSAPAPGETNTTNNLATLGVTVGTGSGTANLATIITAGATIADAGSLVNYTVSTINKGDGTAVNVVQRVQLLPSLTVADLQIGGVAGTLNVGTGLIEFTTNGAKYDPATGVLTFSTVAAQPTGNTARNTIQLKVPAGTGNLGQLLAVASVSSGSTDLVPADNVASVVVKVKAPADLVTTIAGPSNIAAGLPATYTVAFANNGPGTATAVVETAQLPAGLSGVVVTDAAGTMVNGAYDVTSGLVTFPALAADVASAGQVFTLTLTAPGQNLPISSSISSGTPDGVTTNNYAHLNTVVNANADVAVNISGPATAVVGNPVTYAVTTTNNGPTPATGIAATLQLPFGLTNVVAGPTVGSTNASYDSGTGLLTFAPTADLPIGGSAVNYVTFTMPNLTGGVLTAAASVISTSSDQVASNNTATLTTSVAPATAELADLVTSISSVNGSAPAGSVLSYSIAYRNNGGAAATNVMPTANLPTGLTAATLQVGGVTGTLSGNVITFSTGPAAGATYNTTTGLLTFPAIASLAPSAAATSYTVAFPAPGSGQLVVTSQVASATTDNGPLANLATSSTTISGSYDVATRLSGPTTVQPSTTNTYTVTMSNNGPTTAATSKTQTVTLPNGATATNISGGGTQSNATITFPAVTNLAVGNSGALAYTFDVVMPASGSLVLNATVNTDGETVTTNNTAVLTTAPANQAPVAQNVWNATLQGVMSNVLAPTATTGLAISPLNATDLDGSISSYTLLSLPAAAQGILYVNGVTATAGQTVDPTKLSFKPAAGFIGNATFTYSATDNGAGSTAQISNVALYTIPVGQDQNSTFLAFNAGKGGANKYASNDVLVQFYDRNTDVYMPVSGQTNGGLFSAVGTLLNGAGNGLSLTGTNATIVTGTGTLPRGVSLDPATGRIYVSSIDPATGLENNKAATPYTVTVRTTDLNGGTNDVPVTFTIGAYPLPVELTLFEVKAAKQDALLSWTTASEKNNDHFDVERSTVGATFVKISQVKGQGTSSSPTAYALTDAGIGAKASGQVYYRLKQVDADGTATYSPVRTVTFTKSAIPAISLFPNPATTSTQLDLTQLPTGTYQVSVLDATGRVILGLTLEAGLAHALDLNTIASGTYMVVVRGQNSNQAILLTKRLIKE